MRATVAADGQFNLRSSLLTTFSERLLGDCPYPASRAFLGEFSLPLPDEEHPREMCSRVR